MKIKIQSSGDIKETGHVWGGEGGEVEVSILLSPEDAKAILNGKVISIGI